MALILCEDGDPAAAWAAAGLCKRGVAAELLPSSQLGDAARWEHRLDAGAATTAITLADGRVLSSDAPVPILNRLGSVPLRPLCAIFGKDYGYAVQELSAFYLSWLHAWPATVVNRPVPQGLCGRHRHASQWTALAAEAGLETSIWVQSSDDAPERGWTPRQPAEATAFVVAGRPLLPPVLPASFARPLGKLAALAGTALIGIDFVRDPERGWIIAGGSPAPNLILGGEPLIDALALALAA